MQSFDSVTLRVFLAVGRNGSISAAAREVHIASSAASRRLSDLEYNMGTALITRSSTGATLTAAGEVFAKHCEKILEQMAQTRADMDRFSEGDVGQLRVSAVSSVINGKLPRLVAQFRKEHPVVEVSLHEIYSHDGMRHLREGIADIVIISDTEDFRGYSHRLYSKDPVWVMAKKGHPLFRDKASEDGIAFDETLDYDHISLHEGGVLDELVIQAAKKAGREPNHLIKVNRFDSLRNCVEAGLGLGFKRESSIIPYLGILDIEAAPLLDDWADRRLVSVFPKGLDASSLVMQMLDLLEGEAT